MKSAYLISVTLSCVVVCVLGAPLKSFDSTSHDPIVTLRASDGLDFSFLKPTESCAALQTAYILAPNTTCSVIDFVQNMLADATQEFPTCNSSEFMIVPDKDVITLEVLLPVPPKIALDSSTVNTEASSYYWYYRAIQNVAGMAFCSLNNTNPVINNNPKSPWNVSHILSVNEIDAHVGPYSVPLVAILQDQTNSRRLSVVIRGTQNNYEWSQDFDYGEMSDTRFPGKVHSGFVGLFDQLQKAGLFEMVASSGASEIVVTGHSLGAAVATLVAYHIQNIFPDAAVSALLFSPPNVGDIMFTWTYNRIVNTRRIVYGYDLVPRVPCTPVMPKCVDGNADGIYDFSHVGGTVQVNAENMPLDTSEWVDGNTWNMIAANHICSYMCYFGNKAGVEDNWCFLSDPIASEGTLCPN